MPWQARLAFGRGREVRRRVWGSGGRRLVSTGARGQAVALASLTPPRLKDTVPGDELPLTVILHGLLGSSNNWRSVMARDNMLPGRYVCALDLRNHGRSQHADSMSYEVRASTSSGPGLQHRVLGSFRQIRTPPRRPRARFVLC